MTNPTYTELRTQIDAAEARLAAEYSRNPVRIQQQSNGAWAVYVVCADGETLRRCTDRGQATPMAAAIHALPLLHSRY